MTAPDRLVEKRDEQLRDDVRACAAALGRIPLTHQYDQWVRMGDRRRRPDDSLRASSPVLRKRFGRWDQVLNQAGFNDEEIARERERFRREQRIATLTARLEQAKAQLAVRERELRQLQAGSLAARPQLRARPSLLAQ